MVDHKAIENVCGQHADGLLTDNELCNEVLVFVADTTNHEELKTVIAALHQGIVDKPADNQQQGQIMDKNWIAIPLFMGWAVSLVSTLYLLTHPSWYCLLSLGVFLAVCSFTPILDRWANS